MEEKSIEQLITDEQPLQFEQRQLLQEPDLRLESVKAAATIPCHNLEQFMDNCEFIYQYMTYKEKRVTLK